MIIISIISKHNIRPSSYVACGTSNINILVYMLFYKSLSNGYILSTGFSSLSLQDREISRLFSMKV